MSSAGNKVKNRGMKMKIYLIRHGRQNSGLCNVNVELSEEGHRQAELTGLRLKGYGIEAVYSSDLIRAQQTAQHIAECNHLTVITAPDIEEIHFGEWTGKTEEYIDTHYPEERVQYRNGLSDITYENGESGESCYKRYQKGIQWIVQDAEKKGLASIAVVTHGIAMRAFMCGQFGMPFAKRGTLAKSLENGSITELSYQNGVFTLERFNDYAHIEPYDELLRKHFK